MLDAHGILAHNAHVSLGSFDFLLQVGRGVFSRQRVAFFSANRFVQEDHRVFQLHQTRACIFRGTGYAINFPRQYLRACFELAQLPFEGE